MPSGTVARKNDIPLWFKLLPHCRIDEWIALKIWFALSTVASLETVETRTRNREKMDKVIEALRRISTCLPERYQQLVSNEKWQNNKLSSVLVEKEDILDVLRKYLRVCTRVWTWTRYRDILSSFNYAALSNCDGKTTLD